MLEEENFLLFTVFTSTFHDTSTLFHHHFKLNDIYFHIMTFSFFAFNFQCFHPDFVCVFTFRSFPFYFSRYLHFVSSSLQTQCTFTGKQFTSWCCNPILWKILQRLRSKSSSPTSTSNL